MRTTATLLSVLALGALLGTAVSAPAAASPDPVQRHEAEDALLPPGSNAVVKHESGMSGEAYVELVRETGEQRGSIIVFRDALTVTEPGVYRVDIGYKTVAGDYKKQLVKVIEPMSDYRVVDRALAGERVVQEVVGEFQSSGWVSTSLTFKLDRIGTFDVEIQGDWGYQDIDYIDVHQERVAADASIGMASFAFYRDAPEDLTFGFDPNYNTLLGLVDQKGAIDENLYRVDAENRKITIDRAYFEGAGPSGHIDVKFDAGATPRLTYRVYDRVPVRSLYEAEDGTLLGGSQLKTEGDTTFLAITGEGGVQWLVDAPETAQYELSIRYRATSGDKVQDVVVRGAARELRYGVGFPITPFEIPTADGDGDWEVITQRVEFEKGRNTLEIARNWGWTDIDWVRIGTDPERPLPVRAASEISPTHDRYNRNDPRDLRIHLQRNGNDLLSVTAPSGAAVPFAVVPFATSDLDSGTGSNMREIVLAADAVAALGDGTHVLTLAFSDGSDLAYTVTVEPFVRRGALQIVSFGVDHGNATLVRLPNGKNLLIDSGKPEAADAVVLPYLRTHDIRVDYYLVTHFHDDHTGRMDEIIADNGLARMSKAEGLALATQDSATRLEKLRTLQFLDNTALLPGEKLEDIWDLGGVTFEVLNSRYDSAGKEVADLDENNISVAAMVRYRGFSYLHQADTYAKTDDVMQQRFGSDPEFWDVDYLQANHHFHGSVSPTFLRLTNPTLVFVPVSGAVWARGAYTTLYRGQVESYLKENGDLVDTVLSPASGSVVVDVDGADDWRYTVVADIAAPDTAAPALAGVEAVTLAPGAEFSPRAGVTAADNVDGDLTAQVSITGTVDTRMAGTYTLTYAVSDRAGNTASVDRVVTVRAAGGADDPGDDPSSGSATGGSGSATGGSGSGATAAGLAHSGGTFPLGWAAGGLLAFALGALALFAARRARLR